MPLSEDCTAFQIKKIFEVAKYGTEDEVREMLVSVPAKITELEQAYDMDFDSTFAKKREARLEIKYYNNALTSLRAALAKHNRRRKDAMVPRTKNMNVSPEILALLIKNMTTVSKLSQQKDASASASDSNKIATSIDITETLSSTVIAANPDPIRATAFAKLEEKLKSGMSFEDIKEQAKLEAVDLRDQLVGVPEKPKPADGNLNDMLAEGNGGLL